MRFHSIDTETCPFSPGDMAPLLVCVSTAWRDKNNDQHVALFDHKDGAREVERLVDEALASPDSDPFVLVLHNGPYDFAVVARELNSMVFMRKIFALYKAGRVWDTLDAERLLDTADGMLNLQPWPGSKSGFRRPPKGSKWYGLARLTEKYTFEKLDKTSGVRTDFGYLRGTPIEEWPETHVEYAKKDAASTLDVQGAQWARAKEDTRNMLADLGNQCESYWALQLISIWGLITDLPMVAEYKAELEAEMDAIRAGLAKMTMLIEVSKTRTRKGMKLKETSIERIALLTRKVNKDGEVEWATSTKVLRALIEQAFEAQGLEVPRTDPSDKFPQGQVATDAETIEECSDERLAPWKAYKTAEKMLSTYVPELEKGIVHPRYGFASSGRTTSFDPNIQNLPRKGKVRECYIPRPGRLFWSVDYAAQELVTFAQVMHWTIGQNSLSDALNQNLDPHLMLAARRLGLDYDESVRRHKSGDELVGAHRQKSKGSNFGYPGGMGPDTFVEHMRSQDPPEFYTREEAVEEREVWFKTWNNDPRRYFRWVSQEVDNLGYMTQFISKRIRGGVGFSDGANTLFQGLAADMSKAATVEVVRRCYTVPKSALFGSRVGAMIHDELLGESDEELAPYAAREVEAIMLEVAKRYCPDVKSKAEPTLMRRWYKNAKYVTNKAGILIPWEPAEVQEKRAA